MGAKRKNYYGEYEVLKTVREGKDLLPTQVLVKLRKPGEPPKWQVLEVVQFDAEARFRERDARDVV